MISKDNKTVKLISFSKAKRLEKGETSKYFDNLMENIRYQSPEQISLLSSFKNDIWQLGCVFLEFCTGAVPFSNTQDSVCKTLLIQK